MNDFSKEFAELTEIYKKNNRYFYYEEDFSYCLHYKASLKTGEEVYGIRIIAPHIGNDYHWILRANPQSRKEGWKYCLTGCLWEYWYDSFEELKKNLFNWENNIHLWEG